MRISSVCSALIGKCYFDRKIGYFVPKVCLPADYEQKRYHLMPEYSVAHIRRRYVDYLISVQKYSSDDISQYGINLSEDFPLVKKNYLQKKLPDVDCSMWLCESCKSNEDDEIERLYLSFKELFENERKITLFQAMTEYAHPLFAEQKDDRDNQFIGKVHRFNEDHNLEEEYALFEMEFLRIYAILWCREYNYCFIDDMRRDISIKGESTWKSSIGCSR